MNANEDNPLERQMQSWIPREPSPGLEHRIFKNRAESNARVHWPRWSWLAPAASVSVILVQLAVHRPGTGFVGASMPPATFATTSLSNRDLTAYAPGWVHSDRNGPIRDTFEWTNTTVAPSTMRTLPVMLSMTNSLFE